MDQDRAIRLTDTIPVSPPIDLASTLDGGQAFRWWSQGDGFRGVIGRRAYLLREIAGAVAIESVDSSPIDAADRRAIERYLGLDYDLAGFAARFATDRCIGPAISAWPGLRLLRQDPWECLVAFICSSCSNIPRIKLNVGALARNYGDRVGPGDADFAFPDASRLASAGESALRKLGLGFRARYVAGAADAVASGRLDLQSVQKSGYEGARNLLTALDGVGEKVADCALAFAFDKREAFPIDRWVMRALVEWYGAPEKLSPQKTASWARERFGQDGAYVQQYLFHRQRLSARAGGSSGAPVPARLSSRT